MSHKKTFGKISDISCQSLCLYDRTIINKRADAFANELFIDGTAVIKGNLTAQSDLQVQGNVSICGDLNVKGILTAGGSNVGSGFAGNIEMEGLVGFWFFGVESSVPGLSLALFDGETGVRLTDEILPIPGRVSESKQQWGRGDRPKTLASCYINGYTDDLWHISKYDCHTKETVTLDLSQQFTQGTYDGVPIQYDPLKGLFVVANYNYGAPNTGLRIRTVHPTTGVVVDLTAANGNVAWTSGINGDVLAMELIGDYIVAVDRFSSFYIYTRATGQFVNTVIAKPISYVWPGGNPLYTPPQPTIFGMALDRNIPRLYLLLGRRGELLRLLGHIDGATENDIVASIYDGYTFISAKYPLQRSLNTIAWVPES